MFLFTHLIMATLTPFRRYRSIRDWLQCTVYVRLPTPEAQLTYLRIHESTRVHLGHMAESRASLYRRPWLSGVIASLAYILQHIERARVLPIFSRYTNYHFTLHYRPTAVIPFVSWCVKSAHWHTCVSRRTMTYGVQQLTVDNAGCQFLVMDDFEISKHDRFRFDFLKKI